LSDSLNFSVGMTDLVDEGRDTEKLSGHSPGQPAVGDTA